MREVMLAIRPYWCEKIVLNKKTLEIRKSSPADGAPFKVYMYVTKRDPAWIRFSPTGSIVLSGKVVGEFVCDKVHVFGVPYPAYQNELPEWIIEQSLVRYYELHKYAVASNDCNLHGWNISEMKEYDEPLDLRSFLTNSGKEMVRPPQSWCYCHKR